MGTGAAHVDVLEPRRSDGWVRLEGRLTLPDGRVREAWFEFESPDGRLPPRRARPFVLAFLPLAMRAGLPLRCETGADPGTLANLAQWQAVFAHWFPWSLEHIPLEIPAAREAARGTDAVLSFSGGVDSSYALARRVARPAPGEARVAEGLMIHGFDIPLREERAFEARHAASSRQLARFGVRALRMRTNVRELGRRPYMDWARETHGIWLTAAMSCLEPWRAEIAVAASDIASRLTLPWASNPITDRFLEGDAARLGHVGAELSRLGKVRFLGAFPGAVDDLRVCFERPELGENCGQCRKCLTLQLALEALGLPTAGAFPDPAKPKARRDLRTTIPYFQADLLEIAEEADRAGRHGLAAEARRMVATSPLRAAGESLRRWFRRVR